MLRNSGQSNGDVTPVFIQNSASAQDGAIHQDCSVSPAISLDEAGGMPAGVLHTSNNAKIVRIGGAVTIFRADGTAQDAKRGDLVHQGDTIETGADSGAGIAFADGTIFNLSARTHMVVGEFLYDPGGRSNSALVKMLQGTFAYIAGKIAGTGKLDIETPIGTVRVRGTASSSGIGVVTLAALTLYGLENAHAVEPDPILENDTIGYYGTYVLLSRDDPSRVLAVVDDPDIIVVLHARGSAEYLAITPAQRAQFEGAYQDALRTFLIGQQDMFFNQTGPGGSGTPPGGPLAPLLFEQYGNGVNLLNINLNANDIPFLTHDPLPPPPPPPLPPTLSAQPASGLEQTAIPLNVAAAGNGNSVTSLVIGNIPVGATLSDGTNSFTAKSGSTSVDIIGWNLSSLTITTTNDTNFVLSVTATTTDSSGHTLLLSTNELVTVFPLAPNISAVEVKGVEWTPIPLKVTASADGDSTLSSLVIGNIPVGATLSDGTNTFTAKSANTSVDVIGWNLSALTITPTTDTNFTLSVTATSTDSEGQTNTASTTELAIVDPLAPSVSAVSVEGVENTAIPLKVAASADGDSTLSSLVIGNIPLGATLSDGTNSFTAKSGSTSVDIIGWNLSSLTIKTTSDTNFTLSVTATSTDSEGQTNTASTTELVIVDPLAPSVSAVSVEGVEGTPIALKITASANGDSTLASLVIGNIPVGATLSDGSKSFTAQPGDTSVDVIGWNLATLTITPTTDANFTLSVTATSTDSEGQTNTASTTELVIVDPLAPSVSAVSVEGVENAPIALKITASANGDSSLSSLLIGNIPLGATLSDGTHTFTAQPGSTSVDIIGWNLSTLTITATTDTNFTLSVTATATDSGGQSHSTSTTEVVVVDPLAPIVSAVAVDGVEGTAIPLQITAFANGDSTLSSLVIGNIPVGATLTDGAGHTFTATSGNTSVDIIGWNLVTLTITPTTDADFTLSITATSTDSEGQTNTASTTEAVTVEVADDHWSTASNGNWSSDPHWTLGSPTASMTAVFDANVINGTSSSYTVTISQPAVAAALIINDAKATVRDDASLTLSGALTINSGTFELNNGGLAAASIFIGITGTLLVSHGDYVISEPITDYGTIEVARDSLEVAGSIFPATGVFQIDAGATLQLDGADSLNVIFTGSTGELVLKDPAEFTGEIIGLSGSDTIDLANLSFGTNTKVSNVAYSTGTNITTLTVTDGTSVDTIHLVGDYTGSTWTLSSDGSGGTLLTDPPVSDPTLVADADAASAGSLIGVPLGSVMPFENALAVELNTMLPPYQDGLSSLQLLIQTVTNGQNPLANSGQLQTQILDLSNGHNPVANPTTVVDTQLGSAGTLLPAPAATSDAMLIANAEAASSGLSSAAAPGPISPLGNAHTLELNTMLAAWQDGSSSLQQLIQNVTNGQNPLATNGQLQTQIVDLSNGSNPVANPTTVVDTQLGSGGTLVPAPAATSDAMLIANAEAASIGSSSAVAPSPVAPLASAQTLELNTMVAASQDALGQLQQLALGVTGGQSTPASTGQLQSQIVDLTNGQSPVPEPTTIVDVCAAIAHHDFLIHA
jgi:hypothetical protein